MIGAQYIAMNKKQVSELWLLVGQKKNLQHIRHIFHLPQRGTKTSHYTYGLKIINLTPAGQSSDQADRGCMATLPFTSLSESYVAIRTQLQTTTVSSDQAHGRKRGGRGDPRDFPF